MSRQFPSVRAHHQMTDAEFIARYGSLPPVACTDGTGFGTTVLIRVPGVYPQPDLFLLAELTADSLGVPTWEFTPDVGNGGLSSKYWVDQAGQEPRARYQTIQSAIDAAVADGHNAAQPTAIFVMPGNYPENLVLAPGINIVGMGRTALNPVNVLGTFTLASAANGGASLSGMRFSNAGTCTLGGTGLARMTLLDCVMQTTAGTALLCSNTNPASHLTLQRVSITSTDATANARALRCSAPLTIEAQDSELSVALSRVALDLGASIATMRNTSIIGQVLSSGPFSGEQNNHIVQGVSAYVLTAGALVLRDGSVDANTHPVYAGTGSVVAKDVVHPNLCSKAAALVSSVDRSVHLLKRALMSGAGPHTFPFSADVLEIDTTGAVADVVVNLPSAALFLEGTVISVKLVTPLPVSSPPILVQVTPAGVETIDGFAGGAPYLLAPGPEGFQQVELRVRLGNWETMSVPRYPAFLDTTGTPGDVPATSYTAGRASITTGLDHITVNALKCRPDSGILITLQSSDGATPGLFALPMAGSFEVWNSVGAVTLTDVNFTWELRS